MLAGRYGRGPSVCLLLLATVLVASLSGGQAFESNKLYRYQLEGSVASRVADETRPQQSGMLLSSGLLLKRTGSDELLVKLEQPRISSFNELVDDPQSLKLNQSAPLDQQQAGQLDKPFRIYLEAGAAKAFDSFPEEPKWVSNLKRGLLSLFSLQLKPAEATQQSNSDQFYSTSENSVFGDCETDYLVQGQGARGLRVTKTRNMAKCKTRFHYRFMPIDAAECFENERDVQQYKHSNAIFTYDLEGSRDNYVIREVQLDEQASFAPFGQKAHRHQIESRFVLRLVDASASGSLAPPDGAARTETLAYDPAEVANFYANVNLEEAHHLANIYQTSASVEQTVAAAQELVQEQRAYSGAFEGSQSADSSAFSTERSRLGELFIRLNELVGTLNSQKIEQLYTALEEKGEPYKKVFWDVMSVAGTNPSFVVMKKLITENDPPSVKIKDFLTRLSYHIKMPSKSLFDEYVNLCKSDKIQTEQQYRRLCSLPLASLIHQHCAKPHARYLRLQSEGSNSTAHKRAQNTCQITTAEEYFARLVTPFASSGANSAGSAPGTSGGSGPAPAADMPLGERLFNIKLAGELGVRVSIDYLAEVLRNRDEHPSIRAAAMWNLAKVAHLYPAQVRRLVVPYYYDRNEPLELRLAALYNWIYSGMSLHDLETLAEQLNKEPSRQLVLYVHSLIKSMSELHPFPCQHGYERKAQLVLPAIKRAASRHAPASLGDSQASMSSFWQPEFGYGTATLMSAIFANDSLAPSNLFYASSEFMSGIKLTPMSVSVQTHGLDKLIKRVAGINGLLADKESFMDVFSLKRRSSRQAPGDLLKQEQVEIERELKLAQRDFSDVFISVVISAYGRPVTFLDRDSRELKKMLSEDGTIKIPQIKKLLHSFNNHTTQHMMIAFEKLEVFNNELGLPLYQSIQDFDYKTFKLNSVKIDAEPGFFKDERGGKPPTRLSAALDAKMGRHNEILVSSGVLVSANKQQAGVGFYKRRLLAVPLKMSLDASLLENKLTVKRQPIHEGLLYIRSYPVSFVRGLDPSAPARASWVPIYELNDSSQMRPFKWDYMTPLAVGIRLEGKHRAGQDYSLASWRRWFSQVGPQAAKFMYFYSPTGAPLELRLSTVTTEENPTKEVVSTFSWHHNHDDAEGASPPAGNEVEKELEQYTAQGGLKPTSVNYKLSLAGGSSKERKVSLDVGYSRSADRLLHKWRAFYQRTPLEQAATGAEEAVTNLCWFGTAQFPRYQIDKLLKLDQSILEMDHSVNLTSELTFGDQCTESGQESQAARLSARLAFDWTHEQRSQIEAALSGNSGGDQGRQNGNKYAELRASCMRARAANANLLDQACLRMLQRLTLLQRIQATVDYRDVPERWVRMARRLGALYTYARAGYIEEMDDSRPAGSQTRDYKSPDGKRDRAHLSANLTSCSMDRRLSYEFDTPNYHVLYRNVPVSVSPVSTFPLFDASYYKLVQRHLGSRLCSVSGNQVTTFDNLNYTMPNMADGCMKLLAKDCSPEANFMVLAAKVGPSASVLKVYLANKFKIEFIPDKEAKKLAEIKVNGDTIAWPQEGKPHRRDTKLGARTLEAFTIDNNGAYHTLNSKLYKLSVSTDGTWILIQQSKYYAGKSCGLCADSNGDQLQELRSPYSAREVCATPTDFVWSYVLPSTCASRPANIECGA